MARAALARSDPIAEATGSLDTSGGLWSNLTIPET